MSYEEFLTELYSGLKDYPFRLKDSFIQNADATVSWLWLTSAKDQSKNIPTLNALSREDHYDAIRARVRETAVKNKKLSNVVLRIHVELKEQIEDNGGGLGGGLGCELDDEGMTFGRTVVAINSCLDCRAPPVVNVRGLPALQRQLLQSLTRHYART